MDETAGPSTKLDYDVFKIKVGPHLIGKTVDYMGSDLSDSDPINQIKDIGTAVPLMNKEVTMEDRQVISEPFFTGVKVHNNTLTRNHPKLMQAKFAFLSLCAITGQTIISMLQQLLSCVNRRLCNADCFLLRDSGN